MVGFVGLVTGCGKAAMMSYVRWRQVKAGAGRRAIVIVFGPGMKVSD